MERGEIVDICNHTVRGYVENTVVARVITEYCIEHDKPLDKTQVFVSVVMSINYVPFFSEALEYYKRKFTIITLLSKPSKDGINVIKYF